MTEWGRTDKAMGSISASNRCHPAFFTCALMRREAQRYIGIILIPVRLSEGKQRSMTISPLYPRAASSSRYAQFVEFSCKLEIKF